MEHSSFSIDEQPYASLFKIYDHEFLSISISKGLIDISNLSIAGDGMPVTTSARERKHRICKCSKSGITSCHCDCYFSQPDCDIGYDSSRECFYHGYHLYILVAANSESDLPLFPLFNPASKHDSHGFLEAFTIGKDGVPICKAGRKMNHDGSEPSKARLKFRCPLASRKYGCSCSTPYSDSKYGRTVHLAMKDNPRLINFPPRDSEEWKLEYNARTSAEHSNKREKIDFQLESGRHRSTKMWYCRLYHILMLQHLDVWNLPFESTLAKLILNVA